MTTSTTALLALLLVLCTCAEGRQLQQSARPLPAITGGWTVKTTAFDYLAATLDAWKEWDGCGGSLIAPRLVLTAAHCIGRNSPSYVLLRTRNINSRRSPAEVIRVTKRIKHPQYDITGNVDNDAALLVLEKASKAAPVALAAAQFALKSTDKLLVAGWGAVSEDEDMSERLLYAKLPFIPRAQCVNLMLKNPKGGPLIYSASELPTSHICAGWGTDNQDSCPGDSGGPLVKETKSGHKLFGIVSWGLPTCGVGRGLGAYTDVRLLHKWINQTRTAQGV